MKTINISFRFFATVSLICLIAFTSNPTQAVNTKTLSVDMLDSCPTASFYVENNGSAASIPIRFANQSSGATSYLWDFGDGTTSTAANPTHVYGSAGTYTVKLLAITNGCTVEFIGTDEVLIM